MQAATTKAKKYKVRASMGDIQQTKQKNFMIQQCPKCILTVKIKEPRKTRLEKLGYIKYTEHKVCNWEKEK